MRNEALYDSESLCSSEKKWRVLMCSEEDSGVVEEGGV